MKARPVKIVQGEGYVLCPIAEATHVTLKVPGPSGLITFPIITHGSREGTNCWSWNGSMDKPTLKPSVLTTGTTDGGAAFRSHSWINDGRAQFLEDSDPELAGKILDLLEVEGA